jgi:hypothetical protein
VTTMGGVCAAEKGEEREMRKGDDGDVRKEERAWKTKMGEEKETKEKHIPALILLLNSIHALALIPYTRSPKTHTRIPPRQRHLPHPLAMEGQQLRRQVRLFRGRQGVRV